MDFFCSCQLILLFSFNRRVSLRGEEGRLQQFLALLRCSTSIPDRAAIEHMMGTYTLILFIKYLNWFIPLFQVLIRAVGGKF